MSRLKNIGIDVSGMYIKNYPSQETFLKAVYDKNSVDFNAAEKAYMPYEKFRELVYKAQEAMKEETGKQVSLRSAVKAVGFGQNVFTSTQERLGANIWEGLRKAGLTNEIRNLIGRNVAYDTDRLRPGPLNRTFIYDNRIYISLGDNSYEEAYVTEIDEEIEELIYLQGVQANLERSYGKLPETFNF